MQENIFTNWFNSRKVSDSVLKEFNVHWGVSPIMGECIVIPVVDENKQHLFNKYRRNPLDDSKPKYTYDKGGRVALYGWWKAKDQNSIVIVEGEGDALVMWSQNIPAVTSTGGAMCFQAEWANLFKDKDVTVLFDNDEAGAKGMVKVLRYIPHAHICFLPDRPGVKDVTDYISSGGNIHELLRTRKKFSNINDIKEDKLRRIAVWQSTHFHDAYIEENTVPEYVGKGFNVKQLSDIDNAKTYPINKLIKFNNQNKALCIFHSEKTPSLNYYPKDNKCFCFGCGRGGDAIDVYRHLNNCSFSEAVKALNNQRII